MIKHGLTLVLFILPVTAGAHFFDGEDPRVDFTGEGYPYRAVGKLITELSNGNAYACTAFLTGPNEITTARHCLKDASTGKYVKEVFFELTGSAISSQSKDINYRFRAEVPQSGESWKFEMEGAVSLALDLDGEEGVKLGDLVGYFGVSGLHVRKDGHHGTLPNHYSSRKKRDFCKRDTGAQRPLQWLHDHHATQPAAGEGWTATAEQQKTIVGICSAGFPNNASQSVYVLMVENDCGLGGALFDGARSTCWTSGGVSGGPLFYYEDGHYYAIAIHSLSYPTVQNANGARKSPDGSFLIGEPFGPNFFNFAALIIPDVFGRAGNLKQDGFYPIPDLSSYRTTAENVAPQRELNKQKK